LRDWILVHVIQAFIEFPARVQDAIEKPGLPEELFLTARFLNLN
jgi:hypothetical protein